MTTTDEGGWYICDYCVRNLRDLGLGNCLCAYRNPPTVVHKRVAIDDDRPYYGCLWFAAEADFLKDRAEAQS